jgi:dTDP-glucose 4,6-dehydratase
LGVPERLSVEPGSSFVRRLPNATDCNVVNLDELTYAGNLNNIKDLRRQRRHKLVRGDINNRRLVNSLTILCAR